MLSILSGLSRGLRQREGEAGEAVEDDAKVENRTRTREAQQ